MSVQILIVNLTTHCQIVMTCTYCVYVYTLSDSLTCVYLYIHFNFSMGKLTAKSNKMSYIFINCSDIQNFRDMDCAQRGSGLLPGVWGNGVSMGEGGEGGPGPWEGRKDKQSVPNKGRDNMVKDKEDQPSRTWWRKISGNKVSNLLIKLNYVSMVIKFLILIIVFLSGEYIIWH